MITDLQLQHAAFDLWLTGEGEDNRVDLERAKRIVPIVLSECVTPAQKTYITHYFLDGMTIRQIADEYGVNPSTVSRTIHRGLDKAYSYLRFVSPLFVHVPNIKKDLRRMKGGE